MFTYIMDPDPDYLYDDSQNYYPSPVRGPTPKPTPAHPQALAEMLKGLPPYLAKQVRMLDVVLRKRLDTYALEHPEVSIGHLLGVMVTLVKDLEVAVRAHPDAASTPLLIDHNLVDMLIRRRG